MGFKDEMLERAAFNIQYVVMVLGVMWMLLTPWLTMPGSIICFILSSIVVTDRLEGVRQFYVEQYSQLDNVILMNNYEMNGGLGNDEYGDESGDPSNDDMGM